MSKYQAYPEYKDSGVEWLGKIPASWSLSKMAWNFKAEKGKSGQLLTKDYCGLNPGKYSVYSGQTENNGVMGRINSYEFDTGEEGVLFSTTVGAKAMHLSHLRGKFSLSQNCMIIVPITKRYQIRFSYYHFQPLFYYERGLIPEHMQASFRMEDLYQYPIALPSLEEQKLIASFLDHETAKIDTLIDKQQQLIQLLKEKRQAVISHAVTKGLPSSTSANTPMRDSGVEWLGEVPEHWEMVPLKHLCKFSGGGTPSKDNLSYWTDGHIPWVSPKDMKTFWLSDSQDKLTEKAVQESSTNYVKAGALLMVVRSGILQRTIPIAINTVKITLNQDMKALRFNARMHSEYAANYILGHTPSLLLEWTKEGATVESIEQEYLSNGLVPVPPKSEQTEINKVIEEQMTVFEALENKAVKGIQLLQERRTALISAAVTGKIDVRHHASHPAGDLQSSKSTVHGDL